MDLVTASAISYLVIAGFVWLDAWFPVVPGESLIIAGAVLAAQGELSIWLVLLAGLAGAIAGDNFTYMLGRKLGRRAAERLFRSEKSRGRLAWAQEQLERRPWVILVSRYVPGGRTAVMFASDTFPDGVEGCWRATTTCSLSSHELGELVTAIAAAEGSLEDD